VSLLLAILTLLLLLAVILVVSAPLRAMWRERARVASAVPLPVHPPAPGGEFERDELEAAREAKYREIRDAELDYRTGKLSREDYEAIDRALRAEAIEILNRLEASGA
jgi:hypothetical protein